jgi:hypothetical protein
VNSAQAAPLVVYLCYGPAKENARELRYSLETLREEIGSDPAGVAIYTDRPAEFAGLGVTLVDAADLLRAALAHEYRHRVKTHVLADALRRFGRPLVMLDTDSFVRPGFVATTSRALGQGAAMNHFVRRDPYPDLPPFETSLPHLGAYRLDRENAQMLNSGLVAVTPAHLPLIEDAVALIDRLWQGGYRRHDIEQFAVAETLRLGGVRIALIDDVFVHYCSRWAKRYLRRRLRRRAAGERVPFSKARVRLFKAYWNLRLAMRKAQRVLKRGATWRST